VASEQPTEVEEDDLLKEGGDELLHWADEVLRKAQAAAAHQRPPAGPGASSAPGTPRRGHVGNADAAPATSARGREAHRQQSPGVSARQRRAEELRREMRRMTDEAESECERLAAEEAARRRRLAAEGSGWKDRVNSAAEEMRSNFAHGLFEEPRHGSAGRATGGSRQQAGWEHGMGGRAGGGVPRGGSMPPPPRPPSASSRLAAQASRRAERAAAGEQHESAWTRLEGFLESGSGPIRFVDIPWPADASGSITGVLPGDPVPVAKRRLAAALRRWHPDKWRRILDRVPEAEQARVMERVKSIAQRLLEEKAKLTGPGGVLH